MKPNHNPLSKSNLPDSRQGSTLLVVVALLGMLAFLGFVFYTFAKQERANAISSSDAAKILKAPALEPDSLFDFALMQLILGPSDDYRQSILWGGRHSLLANMFGRDGIPWNGEGVNLIQDQVTQTSTPPFTYIGQPRVDMDYDSSYGGAVDNQGLLAIVDSPVANSTTWTYGTSNVQWTTFIDPNNSSNTYVKSFRGTASGTSNPYIPEPDVGYNAPDINSVFLSYDGYAMDANGFAARVIIPSFFRPQYMRTAGALTASWWQNAPANQVFRPHSGHVCIDGTGGITNIARFVSSTEVDTSVTPNRPMYQSLNLRRPFTTNSFMPDTATGLTATGHLGVWSWTQPSMPPYTAPGSQTISPLDFNLDVDTDGDGILDAILMDLGHPPIRRGDGKLVVPLFAITVRDLNGLINLNATGNLAGEPTLINPPASGQLGFRSTNTGAYVADNISKSNLGLSTFEINPQRTLSADPSDSKIVNSETGRQLAYFLKQIYSGITTSPPQPGRSIAELANLEWMLFNIGRAQFHLGLAQTASPIQNAIVNVFTGKNGETSQFRNFLTPNAMSGAFVNTIFSAPHAGLSVTWSGGTPTNWSAPPAVNNPNPDDNVNFNEGESYFPTRWVHPLDFRGSGQQFCRLGNIGQLGAGVGADLQPGAAGVDDDMNGTVDDVSELGWPSSDDSAAATLYGKQPEMMRLTNSTIIWPMYYGYHSYYQAAAGGVRWGETNSTPTNYQYLMRNSRWDSLLDDPTESIIDPVLLSTKYSNASLLSSGVVNDSVLGVDEIAFLQGSDSDARLAQSRSRIAELMPANMVSSEAATDIRKRFTTVSQDRREFGVGGSYVGGQRLWETSGPGVTGPSFTPPYNPTFPPTVTPGAADPYRPELFAFLRQNPNQYLPQPPNSATQSFKLNVNRFLYLDNSGAQPHYGFAPLPALTSLDDTHAVDATVARQSMARDIYTLLYTMCHVHSSGGAVDTDYRTSVAPTAAQAKEMAQFAINLVDSLDTDSFITAFYYDPDLSNGWQTTAWQGADGISGTTDDNVVYGVERQLLTFSEATAFTVMPTANNSNSPMTIFDDTATPAGGRAYLFFELQNVSPLNVPLASSTAVAANAIKSADWRIRLMDNTETTEYNVLYFLPGLTISNADPTIATNMLQTDPVTSKPILPPGAYFSVASQDGSDQFSGGKYRTSDFRASANFDDTYQRVVPSGGAADTAGMKSVPQSTTTVDQFPLPKCNLDLVWDYGDGSPSASRFVTKNNAGVPGGFISQIAGKASVRLLLQRRVADGGVDSTNTGGVWVTVDKTCNMSAASGADIPVTPLVPPNSGAAPPPNYGSILSYPRLVPLDRTSVGSYAHTNPSSNTSNPVASTAAVALNVNTINSPKVGAPTTTSTTWQLHNDRDFGSLAELLQLPLCGPEDLTNGRLSNSEFYQDTTSTPGSTIYYPTIAAGRILRPDNPDLVLNGAATNAGNRWYRLFDFLEVPNRLHRHQAIEGILPAADVQYTSHPFDTPTTNGNAVTFLVSAQTGSTLGALGSTSNTTAASLATEPFNLPEFFGWPRTHGQINLNMIRHPHVYLGLIDDDQLISDLRFSGQVVPQSRNPTLVGTDETARQWWIEFLRARDSRSTSQGAFLVDFNSQLYLPGTANGRPFRSLDTIGPIAAPTVPPSPGVVNDSPLENTIFRSLPLDLASASPPSTKPDESRRLFEVGTATEHFGTPANETSNSPLPPSVRYRLMSKIMNNTTTRSNSFAVYVTIRYHEAVQITSGGSSVVRVGGHLGDTPTHRGFFVVDRTGAVEQMKILSNNVNAGTITVPSGSATTFPVSAGSYTFQANTDASGVQSKMNGIKWKDLVLFRQTLN